MKIGIVTWITYNNYGTLLQAYALQEYIKSLGYENAIISDELILKDFKPQKTIFYNKNHNSHFPHNKESRLKRLLSNPRRIGRIITSRLNQEKYCFPYYGSEHALNVFRENSLKIRSGYSKEDLYVLNTEYDVFICGSDQIWSVFDSIFNPYYYLEFVFKKKISYAPSMGSEFVSPEIETKIKELLSDYYAISVREKQSAKTLTLLTGKDVQWVCDPTLLHDNTFWKEFSCNAQRVTKNYLLCYFLDNREWYFTYAKRVARKLKLSIKLIPNNWNYLNNENVIQFAVGPKEFVRLFSEATYVLTDSYHGSIFSMIFKKNFLYLRRFDDDDPRSQNIRINSLFDYLDIRERIISSSTSIPKNYVINDYDRISELLDKHREKSRTFLNENLKKIFTADL